MPRLYVRDEAIEIGEIPTVSARFHKDRFHRSLSRRLFLEADPVSGAFALPAPAANATSGALGDSREAYGIRRANSACSFKDLTKSTRIAVKWASRASGAQTGDPCSLRRPF